MMFQITTNPMEYNGEPAHIFVTTYAQGGLAMAINTPNEETGEFGCSDYNILFTVWLDEPLEPDEFFCPEYKFPGLCAWLKENGLAQDGYGTVRSGWVDIPRMRMGRKLILMLSDADLPPDIQTCVQEAAQSWMQHTRQQ